MHEGWLDRLSFGCLKVGVYLSSSFPTFAPCLEHICAGGGGSVANMGCILLCRRGL